MPGRRGRCYVRGAGGYRPCRRIQTAGDRAMRREIFTSEHEAFREMVRSFIARQITPYHDQWERDGAVSRDVWLAAGRAGLLGIDVDEKYGGGGNPDYTYYLIMNEELARAGAHGPGFAVHNSLTLFRLGSAYGIPALGGD